MTTSLSMKPCDRPRIRDSRDMNDLTFTLKNWNVGQMTEVEHFGGQLPNVYHWSLLTLTTDVWVDPQ
jgi:hypothetical protein